MAIFAGLIAGFATGIRILGVVQIPIALLMLLIWTLLNRAKLKSSFILAGHYFLAFAISIYIFYPYLWADPINRFISVFQSLSKYSWGGRNRYFGSDLLADKLPWHYLPVWIGITTPILYLIFFFLGIFFFSRELLKRNIKIGISSESIQDLFFISMLLIPLAAIIIGRSTLYDGWRHAYFVYPYFILIATLGFYRLLQASSKFKWGRAILNLVVGLYLFTLINWMVVNNPHQNIYFNQLSGSHLNARWEMDYWGLSNKAALEYILRHDSSSSIKVREISFTPLEVSGKILMPSDRKRLVFNKSIEGSNYLINNYRQASPSEFKKDTVGYVIFHEFAVDGEVFLTIYKKQKEESKG